jgi:hypothetical protein
LAKIRNVIEHQHTSTGASKVVSDNNKVTRAQEQTTRSTTRQGNASTNASRAFAAQSQGLGGLVAAYAGAAATVFALEAAFQALSAAARAETLVTGTNALAAAIGQSGPRIIAQIQGITQNQLTLTEAAQNANIALSSGFSTDQIEGLVTVGLKASRALGRDLTDSVQRLIRGTSKLEPELLDELGIFVRLDPAVQAYARQLGVSASSLSQFERTQAFANAAIEEGLQKFSSIDTTSPSAQKSLEQLQTALQSLATTFGQLAVEVILPFVNFVKNDLSNTLVLFSGILLLVFNKAFTLIGASLGEASNRFLNWADDTIENSKRVQNSFDNVRNAAVAMRNDIAARGGLATDPSGRFAQAGVPRALAAEAAQARQRFLSGQSLSTKQIAKDMATLRAVTKGATNDINANTGAVRLNSIAYNDATRIINIYSAAQQKAGLGARVLSTSLTALRTALIGVGKVASTALSWFNWVFLAVSALDLLGVDVFGYISSWFEESRERAEQFSTGLYGAFVYAGGGAAELERQMRSLGATEQDFEVLAESVQSVYQEMLALTTIPIGQINSEINRLRPEMELQQAGIPFGEFILEQQQQAYQQLIQEREELQRQLITNPLATDGDTENATFLTRELANLTTQIDTLGTAIEHTQGQLDQSIAAIEEYSSSIAELSEQRNAVFATVIAEQLSATRQAIREAGADITSDLLQRELILENLLELAQQFDRRVISLVGNLSAAAGISADAIAALFSDSTLIRIDEATGTLQAFGITLEALEDGTFSLKTLTDAERDLVITSATSFNAINELSDAYDRGATNADGLSRVIGNLRQNILGSEEALRDYTDELIAAGIAPEVAIARAENFFNRLKDEVETLESLRDALSAVEERTEGLRRAFSRELSLAESLVYSGDISVELDRQGNQLLAIANTDEDILANRMLLLSVSLQETRAAYEQVEASAGIANNNSLILAKSEQFRLSAEATAGMMFSILEASVSITEELRASTEELERQLEVLEAQNSIRLQEAQAQTAQAQARASQQAMQGQVDILQASIRLEEARLGIINEQVDAALQLSQANIGGNLNAQIESLSGQIAINMQNISDMFTQPFSEVGNDLYVATAELRRAVQDMTTMSPFESEARVAAARQQVEEAFIQARLSLFDRETQLQQTQIQDRFAAAAREEDLIRARAEADRNAIRAEQALQDEQTTAIFSQLLGFQTFANTVDSFSIAITEFARIMNEVISQLPGVDATIAIPDLGRQVSTNIDEALAALSANADAYDAIFVERLSSITALEGEAIAAIQAEQDSLITEMNTLTERRAIERAQLRLDLNQTLVAMQQAGVDLTTEAMQRVSSLFDEVSSQVDSFILQAAEARAAIQDIQAEEVILALRFDLDIQSLQDELELLQAQGVLESLQAQVRLTAAEESSGSIDAITAAQETNRLQQAILDQQLNIIAIEEENFNARIEKERELRAAESLLAADTLRAEAAQSQAEIDAQYAAVEAQIQAFQEFLTGQAQVNSTANNNLAATLTSFGSQLATLFSGVLSGINQAFSGLEGFTGGATEVSFGEVVAGAAEAVIGESLSNVTASLSRSRDEAILANNEFLEARLAALETEFTRGEELAAAEANLERERFEQRRQRLLEERLIEDENAAARIASAEEAGSAAEEVTDTLRDRLLAIYDSIQSNLENAFMELNDLLFYGEGDFGEILGNLFRSIQTDIFQTTIAEPLSRLITDNLFAAFGFEGGRQGIENARVDPVSGALFVRPVEELFGIQGVIDKSGEYLNNQNQGFLGGLFGQTRQEMSGIFGGGGFLSQLLQSLFGQGGLFASLLRGIGNLFSNIFGGIGGGGGLFGGLFGGGGISGGVLKASGGFVHMAQGGMLGASVMRRDRVPTMLEPGEFVIRRAAARNIGAANLQAMNATGQAAGNVQVNVTNNGTPQEATASPPKFDGEKFVIDIVTRDLANNGPIRRSIRGGAL